MCAGGALGPGLGAGGGPGGSGLARQRPLFFSPSPRPWRDRPSGPQAGSGRAPLGGRATVTPRARGPFTLGPLGGSGGGGPGLSLRAGTPCSRPLQGVPEASLPRSGVGCSLVRWSLPLPPPSSGFRGLRDRGAGIGDPSL